MNDVYASRYHVYLLHKERDSSYDIQLGCCMLKWNFLNWTPATLQQIFNHIKNGNSLNHCSHDHKSQNKWLINDVITITTFYLCCVVIRLCLAHLDTVHPSNAVLVALTGHPTSSVSVFQMCIHYGNNVSACIIATNWCGWNAWSSQVCTFA